jgi:hypothetical protein
MSRCVGLFCRAIASVLIVAGCFMLGEYGVRLRDARPWTNTTAYHSGGGDQSTAALSHGLQPGRTIEPPGPVASDRSPIKFEACDGATKLFAFHGANMTTNICRRHAEFEQRLLDVAHQLASSGLNVITTSGKKAEAMVSGTGNGREVDIFIAKQDDPGWLVEVFDERIVTKKLVLGQ